MKLEMKLTAPFRFPGGHMLLLPCVAGLVCRLALRNKPAAAGIAQNSFGLCHRVLLSWVLFSSEKAATNHTDFAEKDR
jgi:hypothetical protein